jgi:hypothetical protein
MAMPDAATEALPEGMALRETAEGRWFPACAPLEKAPRLLQVVQSPAVVIADRHGIDETIIAPGHTIDEALEALYRRVYVWHYQQQSPQGRASKERPNPSERVR